MNYEVFHCPDGPRLRALITTALQNAAGAAERPGIRQHIESFRPLTPTDSAWPTGMGGSVKSE